MMMMRRRRRKGRGREIGMAGAVKRLKGPGQVLNREIMKLHRVMEW